MNRTTGILIAAGLALMSILLLPVSVLLLVDTGDSGGEGGGGNKSVANVPSEYVDVITRAGSVCEAITPALLAAQIEQESGWQPQVGSSAGAQGIAQFMPATWASSGMDGDGDGVADINNPIDAIWSQGNYMCGLAGQVQGYIDQGAASGDVVSLTLAAYNAGAGAVEQYGGVPPYGETTHYVEVITANASKYEGSTGGGGGDRGQQVLASARARIGMPYVWGAASESVGYDCSGLVMVAYSEAGVELQHSSGSQCSSGTQVSKEEAQPGDLVCWSGHVAIWAGNDTIVEAPTEGVPVRETAVYTMDGGPYFVHLD